MTIQWKAALLITLMSFVGTVSAQQNANGYEELPVAMETVNEGNVEVLEYFWFGCPHCFAFEPVINKWAESKPDNVDFVREAPPLNNNWLAHSQAYYASQVLGVTEQFFEPMFNAIHVQKIPLREPAQIAEFAGTLGLDAKKFLETMQSFEVNKRIRAVVKKARASGIRSVPSIVVNGKYRTGSSVAGGNDAVIDVINKLIVQESES